MKTTSEQVKEGKIFETELHDAFRHLYRKYSTEWRRVIDSFTAGRLMEKADGDFELTVASGTQGCPFRFRIEAKASSVDTTLAQNFRKRIKAHQNAKMIMANRSGICGIYVFKSVANQEIEIWNSAPMCEWHPRKKQTYMGRPAYIIGCANLESFAEYWVKNPADVLQRILRSGR